MLFLLFCQISVRVILKKSQIINLAVYNLPTQYTIVLYYGLNIFIHIWECPPFYLDYTDHDV